MQLHDHQKYPAKPLLNSSTVLNADTSVTVDGVPVPAEVGEPLIAAVNRAYTMQGGKKSIPQVCYLEPMGTIGSCDTCIVEVNGKLQRSCEALVEPGQKVLTKSDLADVAQRDGFDLLLNYHDLYCT